MLSTGRLLRATKLLCDLKTIEGTSKCSFHVYAINNSTRRRNYVLRCKQRPVAVGFVNFASSDASVGSAANAGPQETVQPPESKVRENQDALAPEGDVLMQITSEGVPLQFPVTPEVPEIADVSNAVTSSELPYDSKCETVGITEPLVMDESEVLLESMFDESSVVPETNSSPLDGSFKPIPLEEDSSNALDQAPVGTTGASTPDITATSSAPVGTTGASTPDITATSSGIPELSSTPPEVLSSVAENVGRFGGEASLQSIGLGSWSPVGIVQQCLEFFHVGLDLPWWAAIALGTAIIRICVFPLVIISQKNAAKMNNNLPEMQAIQLKMSDARERGDRLDAARYAQELMEFMRTKGLNPMKSMVVPLCQAPFFVSMFMGIRGMANAPVESFKEGGLWWFMDLTVPDQFYLLPLITSATLALTIEVGTDMARLNSSNMGMAKYLLRAMPIIIFPFTMNFPAGVLVYWCSTNFISLLQVGILRIPAVRDYFKIDRLIKHDKKTLPIKEKGFVGGMKESWTNMRISRELEERERLDNANFLRAGRGAIKKTYKFDPTQPRPPRNLSSIQLKKRD